MISSRVFRNGARRLLTRTGLIEPVEIIRREIFTQRKNRLSLEEIDAIYVRSYHENAQYGQEQPNDDWESDEVIKCAHAAAIHGVLPDAKKVLVGGCSSGMAVRGFRRLGLEAMGFDISADLDQIALPDVKEYVREGTMTSIPFTRRDRFDLFVSTDVLEHVQLRYIPLMVREIAKLECPFMVHLINHHSPSPDHMTLRPLFWWERQFARYYRLRRDLAAPVLSNKRIYGLNGDKKHVYTFWERVADVPRS